MHVRLWLSGLVPLLAASPANASPVTTTLLVLACKVTVQVEAANTGQTEDVVYKINFGASTVNGDRADMKVSADEITAMFLGGSFIQVNRITGFLRTSGATGYCKKIDPNHREF